MVSIEWHRGAMNMREDTKTYIKQSVVHDSERLTGKLSAESCEVLRQRRDGDDDDVPE